MLAQISEELRTTKQELKVMKNSQLDTEKELNVTREILNTDKVTGNLDKNNQQS